MTWGERIGDTKPLMAADDLVSVVIPTYNGQVHIAETLRSVMAQTHAATEIIVVDDGSSDDTVSVVRTVCPAARILTQTNARVSAARNAGFAASGGAFVCFLDQDDVWHPMHLERQLRCFQRHPEMGAVFSHFHFWPAENGRFPEPASLWTADTAPPTDSDYAGWIYHQFLWDCWALTSATMVRASVFRAHGGFDTTLPYSEDWDLWLRLSQRAQFMRLDWPVVLYRQHPVQGSRQPRAVDYRSELLLRAVAQYGYASADGRRMERGVFQRRIAHYQMQFGCHHLECGDRWLGVRNLMRAWQRRPMALRYLALAAAGAAGWRPGRLRIGARARSRAALE